MTMTQADDEAGGAPALGGERASWAHVETIAGDGTAGFADGVATEARFNCPWGVAADAAGNLYVADHGNNRIRKIAPDGTTSTLAGNGVKGCVDAIGAAAEFAAPRSVAVDAAGNVYVADTDNDRIRKITPQGAVSTFSGCGVRGFADGARALARFHHPNGVALDAAGHVYVADAGNRRIRKVTPGGTASSLAGDGEAGFYDGAGAEARLNSPRGIAVDAVGNVYVADLGNSRIRKLSPGGILATVAGDGRGRHADGPGTTASLKDPCGVAVDAFGTLYIADSENHCIRLLGADGKLVTIAGDGTGVADFADGNGPVARFSAPRGIGVGPTGIVYVADTLNHCIRRITLR